jgi:hypothetical protein
VPQHLFLLLTYIVRDVKGGEYFPEKTTPENLPPWLLGRAAGEACDQPYLDNAIAILTLVAEFSTIMCGGFFA